jgi:hypothetical protein
MSMVPILGVSLYFNYRSYSNSKEEMKTKMIKETHQKTI